jgi:hypothetical protein
MPLGFLDLPAELRLKIYRSCYVVDTVTLPREVLAKPRKDFTFGFGIQASSQLLRSCMTCLREGIEILYGENAFLAPSPFGIRRFITTISPNSLVHIKHLTLDFGSGWGAYFGDNYLLPTTVELRAFRLLGQLPTIRFKFYENSFVNNQHKKAITKWQPFEYDVTKNTEMFSGAFLMAKPKASLPMVLVKKFRNSSKPIHFELELVQRPCGTMGFVRGREYKKVSYWKLVSI